MKTKLILIAMLTLACAGTAVAADQYQYTGKGTVTFNHKTHGEQMDCATCHKGATPEKIIIEDKKQGHDQCLVCHKAEKKQGNKAAPTKCNECHVK